MHLCASLHCGLAGDVPNQGSEGCQLLPESHGKGDLVWFGFQELSESPAQNKQWLWCLAFHIATLGKERSTTPAWSEGVRRKSEPSRGGYILRYHRDLGEDVHAS